MHNPRLHKSFAFHLLNSPTRLSILGFALLIATGTALLMLPASSVNAPLGFIDALFMSTSASCVTGLSIMDIGTGLSHFGQLVLLSLIQVGGLGILTISTLLLMMMKGRPTLSGQAIIKDTFTYGEGKQTVSSVLKAIFITAFSIEAVGALVLYLRTAPQAGWHQAGYPAVFHAISAFCNAGFSLYADSFAGFREDWVVNGVLSLLIIIGGIGFVVIADVKSRFLSRNRKIARLSLHSRLALTASGILILLGTLAILFMEWDNTLAPLSIPGRVLAALFQSVSARTAGFNTLNMGHMANETLFMLCIFMFIGACPGSCGGGVKTTTVAGLMIQGLSRMRGLSHPRIFKRTLTEASISKATSVVMVSMAVITVAIMALMMSELGGLSHAQTRGRFLELFFEVISAFGTVGLSTGVTGTLSPMGRITIVILMFIGRLGPMVIGLAVSRERISRFHYAEENIMIG
ncbi:TrkH family potassium uptake protein [Desulfosarcina ovata]|uniref:K+ transporter Trk n=2 Tax=Desulfosarcina ovata TaxID=83564 RepID=A0A5K8AMZ2_9BACT|nr:potassium transporter TrkG [Desulfosarcina ovata]BBO86299.1 K+ transporter Trk [Desulfosarcina ovata subsp. sediminis]BBO93240.1 K+ transporter Trk [Desulfosarcina ovata subsp. ovata]